MEWMLKELKLYLSSIKEMEISMDKVQEKDIKKKLAGKFTRDNFLIILLAGILLLVIVWPVKDENKNADAGIQSGQLDSERNIMDLQSGLLQSTDGNVQIESDELWTYASYLETSLEELLCTMDGVGKVRVMVTLENSGETVVEKDKSTVRNSTTEVDSAGGSRNTTDISDEEETVYGGSDDPYITKVMAPSVKGVVVSAQGGDNAKIVQNITEAIQALFGIEAHKIKVVKMYSQ